MSEDNIKTKKPEVDSELKAIQLELAKEQLEIAKAEKQARLLEIEERKANAEDTKTRLAKRQNDLENKRSEKSGRGLTLQTIERDIAASQSQCNHRKGGKDMRAISHGRGTDVSHSIIKHMMPDGNIWISCTRCHASWKPPVVESFILNGITDNKAFEAEQRRYEAALDMTTDNEPSGGMLYRFSDGGVNFAKITRATNFN